jgi:hypothetical protein
MKNGNARPNRSTAGASHCQRNRTPSGVVRPLLATTAFFQPDASAIDASSDKG